MKQYLLIFGLLLFIAPQMASAGLTGCSPQSNPGDRYNCSASGPYAPNQLNGHDCRSQCNALKRCVNYPPADGCEHAHIALNDCLAQAQMGSGLPALTSNNHMATVNYTPGVGCFLEASGSTNLTQIEGEMRVDRTGDSSFGGPVARSEETCLITGDRDPVVEYASSHSEDTVIEVASDRLGINKLEISARDDLYDDLGADWYDVRSITGDLASLFEVHVGNEVVDNMHTIGDLVDCINSAVLSIPHS